MSQSLAPRSNMPENSAAVETSFLNLNRNSVAGTPIEEWKVIELMIQKVKNFNPYADSSANDAEKLKDNGALANIDNLMNEFPFLNFTTQDPGVDNPCSEVEYRISVWKDAHRHLGSSFTVEEQGLIDLFHEFLRNYQSHTYRFLPRQPNGLPEREAKMLYRSSLYRLEVWARMHRLGPDITGLQYSDSLKLQRWIARSRVGLWEKISKEDNTAQSKGS